MNRLLSIFWASCFILSATGCAYKEFSEGRQEVCFLGEENDATLPLYEISTDFIITEANISCIENKSNANIITTSNMLSNNLKNEFRLALEQSNRILIIGDLSKEEIREYFDLPVVSGTYSEAPNANKDNIEEEQSSTMEYE